jgi:O-antigen/teichoic acid export membrane protein
MGENKLVKETVIFAIGEIIPKILAFLLLPIYTNYLSPGDYGILSYTNSFSMFLFVLGALSLNSYVLRFYFEQKNEVEKSKLIGNIFIFIGSVNLIIFILSWFLLPGTIEYFHIQVPWRPYFQLALISNLLEGFSIIPFVLFRVKQKAKIFVALSLFRTIFQIGLTYLFIVELEMGLIGHYFGRLISLALFFFIYWCIIIRESKLNINYNQIKEALKFSLPLLPGSLAYIVLSLSDRIILERHVLISQIGIYNVAFTLAFTLNMIILAVYRALEPEFYKRYKANGYYKFAFKVQSHFLFLVYSLALMLTLFSQEVFKILTSDDYYRGYLLVPIIIVGAIMTGQNVVFITILAADKKTNVVGISSFVGAIISLIFNFLLIPYWGIYAAAFSSAIAYLIMNIFLFIKMDFPGKSLKSEFTALFFFVLTTFSAFYIIDIEISLSLFFLKIIVIITNIYIFSKIFNINLKELKRDLQF